MMRDLCEREADLIMAHEGQNLPELVRLYSERAQEVEAADLDAACFYMTNAYVFALEMGSASDDFHQFLLKHQREESHAPL